MQNDESKPTTMLGRYLRHRREGLHLKQADTASRIGMEQSEWSKWETGKIKRPTPERMREFATALDDDVVNIALAVAGLWPLDVPRSEGALTRPAFDPESLFRAYDLIAGLHRTADDLAAELARAAGGDESPKRPGRRASA